MRQALRAMGWGVTAALLVGGLGGCGPFGNANREPPPRKGVPRLPRDEAPPKLSDMVVRAAPDRLGTILPTTPLTVEAVSAAVGGHFPVEAMDEPPGAVVIRMDEGEVRLLPGRSPETIGAARVTSPRFLFPGDLRVGFPLDHHRLRQRLECEPPGSLEQGMVACRLGRRGRFAFLVEQGELAEGVAPGLHDVAAREVVAVWWEPVGG